MIKQLTLVMQSWLAVDPQQDPVKNKEIRRCGQHDLTISAFTIVVSYHIVIRLVTPKFLILQEEKS